VAVECFLKFEQPDLGGEAKADGFAGQIDVIAWSWSASQSGTMHVGTGGGSGKANVKDLSITKWVDKASPNLFQSVVNGKQFEKMTLTCRKAGGDAPVEYLKIEMEKIIITSCSTGGTGGEDQFSESLTLNFALYKESYTPQKDNGTADMVVGPVGWNMRENKTT